MSFLLLLFIGLTFGSFIANYAMRYKAGESVAAGRSRCDNCKSAIAWFDNIPVVSYVLLKGKARCCGKGISSFYPFVESTAAVLALLSPSFLAKCNQTGTCPFSTVSLFSLTVVLLVFFTLFAVLLVDQLTLTIPDKISFSLIVSLLAFALITNVDIYTPLFAGFAASNLLLFLFMITRGRGMGLGDVKLAVPIGFFLGTPGFLVWLYLAFLTGGLVAFILILTGQARLKQQVAFGPFLVVSFFMTPFLYDFIVKMFTF